VVRWLHEGPPGRGQHACAGCASALKCVVSSYEFVASWQRYSRPNCSRRKVEDILKQRLRVRRERYPGLAVAHGCQAHSNAQSNYNM
jgi:hypothetical protein